MLALTEDGKQRFLLTATQKVAMDINGTTPEMLEYRQRIHDFNADRREEIIEWYVNDNALVDEVLSQTPLALTKQNELSLKLMLTYNGQQKERLQDAKGLVKVQRQQQKQIAKEQGKQQLSWKEQQQEFIQSRTDVSNYL